MKQTLIKMITNELLYLDMDTLKAVLIAVSNLKKGAEQRGKRKQH